MSEIYLQRYLNGDLPVVVDPKLPNRTYYCGDFLDFEYWEDKLHGSGQSLQFVNKTRHP